MSGWSSVYLACMSASDSRAPSSCLSMALGARQPFAHRLILVLHRAQIGLLLHAPVSRAADADCNCDWIPWRIWMLLCSCWGREPSAAASKARTLASSVLNRLRQSAHLRIEEKGGGFRLLLADAHVLVNEERGQRDRHLLRDGRVFRQVGDTEGDQFGLLAGRIGWGLDQVHAWYRRACSLPDRPANRLSLGYKWNFSMSPSRRVRLSTWACMACTRSARSTSTLGPYQVAGNLRRFHQHQALRLVLWPESPRPRRIPGASRKTRAQDPPSCDGPLSSNSPRCLAIDLWSSNSSFMNHRPREWPQLYWSVIESDCRSTSAQPRR